ncbi:MAG TPA: FtsX-like permease family protein [Streptosporangiaceae bacterium]|nr:FtsX-like permease family protein [Streptosporangiaceae bacterium]
MRRVGGGTIALGVLVCAGVFAAVSGPALSLHLRTQALQQTLNQLGGTVKTVQASASLSDFLNDVYGTPASINPGPGNELSPDLLEESQTEIRDGLAQVPLPLAAGDWAGLATKAQPLASGYSASAYVQQPPKVALVYRDTLSSNTRLVAGSLSSPASAAQGTIPVSVTSATAARFGVRPGSRLTMGTFTLLVTGIVRARDANDDFWQTDPAMLTPEEQISRNQPAFWLGEFAIDPDGLQALQQLPSVTLLMQWEFPLSTGGVNADQVTALGNGLSKVSAALPQMSGAFAAAANDISVSTSLLQPVQEFVAAQTAVLAVLLLLFVSLAMTAAAVIVLAGRMIVDRRSTELVMLRSRGASTSQVATLLGRSTALIAIPAAAAGAALALVLVPGAGSAPGGQGGLGGWLPPGNAARLGWTLASFTLLLALVCAPAIGTWRHRRPAPAANPARVTTADTSLHLGGFAAGRRFAGRGLRRLIAEVTACGLAIAGLVVLHGQGVPPAGSTNWFLTAAPALAAIPAVIVILRLYPLIIRIVLRLTGRRAGPTGYIALASSAGTSLATTAPAFALVLALTVSAFGGMVTDAINSGQVSSSWQTTGADVLITTGLDGVPITRDTQRVLAGIRGVKHEAAVSDTSWFSPSGRQIEATAVAPAQYATLTAATPFPALPAHALVAATAPLSSQSVTGVLASPAAAAILGTGVTTLNSLQGGPLRVRVVGLLASTPAQPTGGPFILLPLPVLPPDLGQPLLNVGLLTGTGIDRAQLDAAVSKLLPGSSIAYRSDVLASLRSAPLQHGAELLIVLTIVAAAGFGLLNLILGLALGAADRDLTSARLAVMGYEQAGRLAVTETLPAVLAATAGGLACALVLPPLVSNALDLSVFTNSSTVIPMRPGLITVGLPAAAMLLLAVIALALQTWLARRRGATGLLRIS